jgi:Flp pilus assembly protein CpaB
MAIEFRDRSARRRRLMLIVGVLCALLAGYWAYSLSAAATRDRAAQEPPKRTVVVAAHEIGSRTVVGEADVTTRQIVDDASLAQAFADPAAVVGRVTSVALLPGQVLYPNVLVTTAEGAPFSILAPDDVPTADAPYWRAVSVQVPRERAVGGQIVAGQRVDLFVTLRIQVCVRDAGGACQDVPTSEGYETGDATKVAFQDLEVLQARPDESMYILKVDLDQAEAISHVAAVSPSAFSLALRPDGDARIADNSSMGETNDRIILQFGLPLPELINLRVLAGGDVDPFPTVAPGPTPLAETPPPEETPAP